MSEKKKARWFSKAKKAKIDSVGLGAKMFKRKKELEAELGVADEDDSSTKPAGKRQTANK